MIGDRINPKLTAQSPEATAAREVVAASDRDEMIEHLIGMSRELGRPDNDYVILAEGNTSARTSAGTFLITKSAARLDRVTQEDFAEVDLARALAIRDDDTLNDEQIEAALVDAQVDPRSSGKPSTETSIHATCLELPGVRFVGHTHPTAINALACSQAFEEAFAGRLFPDEIAMCGRAPVLVPYVDPGMPLAREIDRRLRTYMKTHGERPRIMLLQNHGLFVFGNTHAQVIDITAMAVKAARILAGTYQLGGPRFLSERDVERIDTRPDEQYRQRKLGLR